MKIARALDTYRALCASEHTDFYRNFYREQNFDIASVQSAHDWARIPLLTRDAVSAVSPLRRLAVPWDMLDTFQFTSGSSGRGMLVSTLQSFTYSLGFPDAQRVLRFRFRTHQIPEKDPHAQPLVADPAELPLAAHLVRTYAVDTITGSAQELIALAQELAEKERAAIRYIALTSERTTPLLYRAVAQLYPQARIAGWYNLSEIGHTATSTPSTGYPFIFTPTSGVYVEITDDTGAPLSAVGSVGHLIVSTFHGERAFPFVRYDTGDMVQITAHTNDTLSFMAIGRSNNELVKIRGGIIAIPALEASMSALSEIPIADFEASVREAEHSGSTHDVLHLTLYTHQPLLAHQKTLITERLPTALKIAHGRTYHDAILRGQVLPLVCTFESTRITHFKKKVRLKDLR